MFPELSNIKPSIYNALMIIAIVVIAIPMLKYATTKYQVPGLSQLVAAV